MIFSDNTNQCDCYRICLDDHIQNAALGIPGSCQQVQSRYLQNYFSINLNFSQQYALGPTCAQTMADR